jgi:UrcA family protein
MTSHTASSVRTIRPLAAAFVAIAISATSSYAQSSREDGEIRTVTVKYADLNLATEEGSRQLYGRLVVAAREVCPAQGDTLLAISQNLEAQRCVDQAVERAVKDIRNPKFAEVAGSRMR